MAQTQVRGLGLSQIEPSYSISLSVPALKFKHIQRDTIALIVMCTQYFLMLWKV